MSGHSKWSNIHRKKEANDKVRSGIFTKMAAAITVAVKKGGGITDPEMNFALRLAVDQARAVNMPKENVERAIARGGGKGEGNELAELVIEGFAPGGAAFIAEVVTDSRNRSVSELRTFIEKHGGRMGEPGSVAYLFERVGIINYPGMVSDEIMLTLIDLGVIDSEVVEGDKLVIYTEPDKLHQVMMALPESGEHYESGLGYRSIGARVKASEVASEFIDELMDAPDVQEVYVNLA